jgi:peptidoglycan/xylan/chitin deacetylase (PgdA/CDA1 family)
LRRIRPRLTVPQATAILAIVLFLFTSVAGNATDEAHNRAVPILMYHVIAPAPAHAAFPHLFVAPDDFSAQMHWLAWHGFHAVTLHQVYEYWLNGTQLPEHPIVLSFDDGTVGQDTHALPVLRSLHWPGVLNLKLNALRSRYTLPAWRVRQMLAAGWELDSHTLTHPDLTHVDDARLWREVHDSRVELQHEFHVPVDFFCYPSGRYDEHVVAAVRAAGYLGATTTNYGLARPADIYSLSRIRIDGTDHLAGFANKLSSLPR